MEWLQNVWGWLNEPLPIVGISTLMVIGAVFGILKNTSFGKKIMNRVETKVDNANNYVATLGNKVDEYKVAIENQVNDLKQEYENKLSVVYAQFDYFESSIFNALEKIPNVKVQEEITKFKVGYESKKEELGLIIGNSEQLVSEKLKEIETLKEQLLSEFDKAVEAIKNGEREETPND